MNSSASAPSEAEVRGYFSELSNWGRWGLDDQCGTLNHMTDSTRKSAVALVHTGRPIGLGRSLAPPRRPGLGLPLMHFMVQSGYDVPAIGQAMASDWVSLEFHGYGVTHVDAPAHMFWNGQMYNGRPASVVHPRRGATVGSVECIGDGIVGRAVLLDVARFRSERGADLNAPIAPSELDACSRAQGVSVESGDVIVVRAGRDIPGANHSAIEGNEAVRRGLHAGCLPWLHERSVALLGSDGTNDARPSGYTGIANPIHAVGIVAMGLWLIDNLMLEQLALTCASEGRWEFCLTLNALRIKNATGAPVNPTALL